MAMVTNLLKIYGFLPGGRGPEDMLVGQLVPAEATDWNAEATVAQVTGEARVQRSWRLMGILMVI
jgi:hypothetical protein